MKSQESVTGAVTREGKRGSAPPEQSTAQNTQAPNMRKPTPEQIREQLEKVVASHRFAGSPRCQTLLKYIVENKISGNADSLKERSIGVEILKKSPDYDTSSDPAVRVAASEVRKKLAQYYYEPDNRDPIRIDLPTGSYVPEFSWRSPLPLDFAETVTVSPASKVDSASVSAQAATSERVVSRFIKFFGVAMLCLMTLTVTWIGYRFISERISPFHRFWKPVLNSPGSAILCVGDYQTFEQDHPERSNYSAARGTVPSVASQSSFGPTDPIGVADMKDVVALTKLVSMLQTLKKELRVTNSYATSLTDLREGPAVLIGGLNNRWAMRISQSARFSLQLDSSGTARIFDRQNPSRKDLVMPFEQVYARDYSIIERVNDPTTGRPAIIAAGLGPQGTSSAVELITTPDLLSAMLKDAPRNWQNMNMEAVLQSDVIDGKVGPPKVIAVEYW